MPSISDQFGTGLALDFPMIFHSHKPMSQMSGLPEARGSGESGESGESGSLTGSPSHIFGCVKFGRTWDLDDLGIPP